MWKCLNYGEKVSTGDTLRYQSDSNRLQPQDHTYLVLRTDQHYFEIIRKGSKDAVPEAPTSKVVRYTDIGYHIRLERWAGPLEAQ
jgi:hypothetical protein